MGFLIRPLAFALLAALVSCGTADPACEPASAEVCFCDGGFPGNQACSADGDWTECYCPFMGTTDTDVDAEPLPGAPNYQSYCSPCHGVHGLGTGDGPALTARVPLLTDAQVEATIRNGKDRMPAFRSFGDPQVADLVQYLRVEFGTP